MKKKSVNFFFVFLINLFLIINAFAANTPQKTDVIIIGAGIAGLAAAQELKKQHYQILVLEAKDRIGGRILTNNRWGTATELGGSWLHSTQVNPLIPIIKKENIPLVSTQYTLTAPLKKFSSISIYKGNGQLMSEDEKQKILELVKKFSIYLKDRQKEFTDKNSYDDVINKFSAQEKISSQDTQYLTYFIKAIISFDNGADLNQFSAKAIDPLDPEKDLGPDMLFKRGGYFQLFKDMIKDVPILLNHKVTQIVYDSDGVKVTAAGHVYKSKYVIVTLPLGVLKKNSVKFTPALPNEKIQAIKDLGYGTYNKIYLLFSKPFWDISSEWLELLPNNQHPDEYYEVLNYYKFSRQPILLVFVTGNYAKSMEDFSDKQIITHIMQRLRLAYGSSIVGPNSYIITRWGQDPYSYGSYSYPRIGSTEQSITNLAKSVSNRLFFAGEATSENDYGTVHGAYLSGIRASKEIIEIKEKDSQKLSWLPRLNPQEQVWILSATG